MLSVAELPPEPKDIQRFIAAENVCAWPNLIVAADGNILAMVFNQANQHPADLLRLKNGRILLSYGSRIPSQLAVQAKFSADEGKKWSELSRIANSLNGDCGYPSSIELSDRKILTTFCFKSDSNCHRYHMGLAIWKPSSAKAD